jgi:hypothetical protein
MAAVAHGWKPDKVKAPPTEVAEEFNEADTGKPVKKRSPHQTAAIVRNLRGGV